MGVREVLRVYDVTNPIFARLTAELPQEVMWPNQLLEQLDPMMLKKIGIREDGRNPISVDSPPSKSFPQFFRNQAVSLATQKH